MEFYYLHEDPKQCATWLSDWDVDRAVHCSVQSLCAAHYVLDSIPNKVTLRHREYDMESEVIVYVFGDERDVLLSPIYVADQFENSKMALWVRESVENYNWMVDYAYALCLEYEYRFELKLEDFVKALYLLQSPPHNLKEWDWTDPSLDSMVDNPELQETLTKLFKREYIATNNDKVWSKRTPPDWLNNT